MLEQLSLKIVCDNFGREKPRPFQKSYEARKKWKVTASSGAIVEVSEKPTHALMNHEVHYMLNAERVETLDDLLKRLKDLRPNMMVKDDKSGEMKPVGVVVEPDHGAVYGDVAPVVDTIIAAEFKDINFGGGMGSMKAGKYSKVLKKPRKK